MFSWFTWRNNRLQSVGHPIPVPIARLVAGICLIFCWQFLSTAKLGDNALGSVCLSVCPSIRPFVCALLLSAAQSKEESLSVPMVFGCVSNNYADAVDRLLISWYSWRFHVDIQSLSFYTRRSIKHCGRWGHYSLMHLLHPSYHTHLYSVWNKTVQLIRLVRQ